MEINLELPENFLKAEKREGYLISSNMKKVWAVELDLLNELIKICKKYDLNYYMEGGSLLGTIRHEGFIPWDDDIDIVMFREDYNKLCKIAEKEFKFPYFFQTEYTDKGTCRGHAQLRNSCTTGILKNELRGKFEFNQGIFIDIFPMDKIPDNLKKKKIFLKKLNRKKRCAQIYNSCTYIYRKSHGIKGIIKKIMHSICRILDIFFSHKNLFYIRFEKFAQKYNDKENANKIGLITLFPDYNSYTYNIDYFKTSKVKKFEMLNVTVPIEYEKALELKYGNWTKKVKNANTHGIVIFDTEKPYKEYIK